MSKSQQKLQQRLSPVLALPMIVVTALLSSCSDDNASATAKDTVTEQQQPLLGYRSAEILVVDGLQFKDLNRNRQLDPYEDWQRPLQQRIDDLVGRMTPKEKAGMMLIQTLNSAPGGALPEDATRFIQHEYMTRFIFRNPVVPEPDSSVAAGFSGAQVTPEQAAEYMNRIQALAESTRLGIPVVFKSNARNHYEQDARPGINLSAGSFSTWPKEAGLAATRDMALVAEFADVMRQEWTSIGLRGMYGYMADLSTEPRWYRVHETFTEDADLAADMITTLVETLQGEQLNPGSVALTIKHFPGGGPQSGGGDPHYWFGRNQAYPANNFDYHLKPFQAAINTGASSIMAYYGVPVGQAHQPNDVGMAFSKGIVTDLLRNKLGFKGYVNSDTGIIGEPGANRAWGLEGKSVEELLVTAIEAGTDVLSGFNNHQQILALVHNGMVTQARVDQSVARLLKEQFMLGLFENPYVDPAVAVATVGKAEFQARADLAQRKSIVLLQNSSELLPLQAPTAEAPISVYTLGMSADAVGAAGYRVTTGDHGSEAPRPPVPADTRYALIRVNVSNPVSSLEEFANEPMPFPGVEPATIFGGARPDELDFLAFSEMVSKKSWKISPSLPDIKAVMDEVGAENTVLSIYFRQPYVLDSASGLQQAGAILGLFGADDAALMDVLTGKYNPSGKLPFALANSANAILEQASDAPGYAPEDTLYPFGFGLSY